MSIELPRPRARQILERRLGAQLEQPTHQPTHRASQPLLPKARRLVLRRLHRLRRHLQRVVAEKTAAQAVEKAAEKTAAKSVNKTLVKTAVRKEPDRADRLASLPAHAPGAPVQRSLEKQEDEKKPGQSAPPLPLTSPSKPAARADHKAHHKVNRQEPVQAHRQSTQQPDVALPASSPEQTLAKQPAAAASKQPRRPCVPAFSLRRPGMAWRSVVVSAAAHAIVALLLMAVVFLEIPEQSLSGTKGQQMSVRDSQDTLQQEVVEVEVTADVDFSVETSVNVDVAIETDFAVTVETAVSDEVTADPHEIREQASFTNTSVAGSSDFFGDFAGFSGGAVGAHGSASGVTAGAFAARSGAGKQQALQAYGGSPESEAAVDLALRWFAEHQSPNGMWDVDGYVLECRGHPSCDPGSNAYGHGGDVACTAYALLCFAGSGYHHRGSSPFQQTIGDGLRWLLQQQDENGSFGRRNYEHPVAAMAVAELCALSGDVSLRSVVERAVSVMGDRQNPAGGWDYDMPSARNDASVTGWNIMALKSAKVAGVKIAEPWQKSQDWLDAAWRAANPGDPQTMDCATDLSRFGYLYSERSGASGFGRECIGLACAVFHGHMTGTPMLETLANMVMQQDLPRMSQWPVNTYNLYYGTLAMFQVGGRRWRQWNAVVHETLIREQRQDGCQAGSWDWQGTGFEGANVGRLLSTAYCCLSLQVYYRYQPQEKLQ